MKAEIIFWYFPVRYLYKQIWASKRELVTYPLTDLTPVLYSIMFI